MSFPTDVALDDLAPVTFTYSQISLEGGKSIRNDATRELGTPRSLVISHSANGSGMNAVDRHLVRLNDVQEDTGSDTNAVLSGSVYMVIEKPRRIISDADVTSMIEQMADFMTSANIVKILNGEP
jgi:hypothetical protein